MAKNMTRKGLALGAVAALTVSGFSLPANAAGLADTSFVSLAPTTGTAYTVVSGNGKTFSLTANEATSVAGTGRYLKFLVTDADSKINPTADTIGRVAFTVDQTSGNTYTAVASTDVVTINVNASGKLAVGDLISFADAIDANGATAGVVQAAATPVEVTAVTGTSSFSFKASADIASDVSTAAALDGTDSVTEVVREARATDGSYVVSSGVATDATNEVLVLAQGDETTTREVTVTAWVDANGNDVIDSTEYVSPTRTVTFKKASEITGTVTWTQPALGDANLVAAVTTSPELNGPQVGNSAVVVKYTRQGSAGAGYDLAAWNSTTSAWDASLDANGDTSSGVAGNTGTDWTSLSDVVAGTYSATPMILTTAIGSAVSATVGSTQADDVKASIAATADNAAGANEDGSSPTAVAIRTGKSVTVTATIYDDATTPAVVGAGIPVTATLSSTTGTIKVDGKATSNQALTDANGQVSFVVSTTSALATDAATLTIQAQNVSTAAKTAVYTLTWDDATVTVYDSAVAAGKNDLNRSVAKNGTVNFGFRIADQWGQALSGSYRLLVENTGNTVSTSYASVVDGAASVSVTDNQIGAGSSISTGITVQKDVSGTWTAQTPTNTNSSNKITYTIGVLSQTDAVTLDADGATVYGSGTADDSDAIAAKATVALDSRFSTTAVPAYANDVVVTGRVANATTAVARAGALVTISGASDLLFSNGGVYAFGSLTFVADASGEFAVNVYSNKVQSNTVVTVSSNGASATKKVSFTTAGAASAKSASFSGTPESAAAGSTFQVVATLADAFGNGVKVVTADTPNVVMSYSGPGIVFGSLPSETAADGTAKFAVLLGSNDSGTATITLTYDLNGNGTYTDTGDFTVSKTVVVGTAGNVGDLATWTKKLDDNSAKIYAKNVVGAGKVQFFLNGEEIAWVRATSASDSKLRTANGSAYLVRTVEFAEGKNVLEVYVDGVRTTRTAYTK